jgi:ABC-type transporter Mla subunit MlaD
VASSALPSRAAPAQGDHRCLRASRQDLALSITSTAAKRLRSTFSPSLRRSLLGVGDFVSKLEDFLSKLEDFLSKLEDFLSKLEDFLSKLGDFLSKLEDFLLNLDDTVPKLEDSERFVGARNVIGRAGPPTNREVEQARSGVRDGRDA